MNDSVVSKAYEQMVYFDSLDREQKKLQQQQQQQQLSKEIHQDWLDELNCRREFGIYVDEGQDIADHEIYEEEFVTNVKISQKRSLKKESKKKRRQKETKQ